MTSSVSTGKRTVKLQNMSETLMLWPNWQQFERKKGRKNVRRQLRPGNWEKEINERKDTKQAGGGEHEISVTRGSAQNIQVNKRGGEGRISMFYFTIRGWNSSPIFICLLAEVNNVHAPSWNYSVYLLLPGAHIPYVIPNEDLQIHVSSVQSL